MSKFFNDMDIRNMTPKEHDAVMTILRSDRAAVLTKFLVEEFACLDESAPTYLFKILTVVVQKMMANVSEHIRSMRGWVSTLGRMLTIDKVSTGSRKGEPAFLTKHFKELSSLGNWDMLVYMFEFCNFQEDAHKVELGAYAEMPTASSRSAADSLAGNFIDQFRKFLHDLETHPIDELVNISSLKEYYPGIVEMIDWCRDNRDKWDGALH